MKLDIVKIDERGRITIPDQIRKKLKLKKGDSLFIKVGEKNFVLYPEEEIKISVR